LSLTTQLKFLHYQRVLMTMKI